MSPSDHETPNLQNKRPAGFVLLLETADTLTSLVFLSLCVCRWGRPFPLQLQLRLGARLRDPTRGQGRPTRADNKADAKGTHAADWV